MTNWNFMSKADLISSQRASNQIKSAQIQRKVKSANFENLHNSQGQVHFKYQLGL